MRVKLCNYWNNIIHNHQNPAKHSSESIYNRHLLPPPSPTSQRSCITAFGVDWAGTNWQVSREHSQQQLYSKFSLLSPQQSTLITHTVFNVINIKSKLDILLRWWGICRQGPPRKTGTGDERWKRKRHPPPCWNCLAASSGFYEMWYNVSCSIRIPRWLAGTWSAWKDRQRSLGQIEI